MAFSTTDKKEVFNFFVELLEKFDNFVYYEYLRGHVTKASPVVKKYVAQKCKGQKLFEYFARRKNYFLVEKHNVALKKERKLHVNLETTEYEEEFRELDNSQCGVNSEETLTFSENSLKLQLLFDKDSKERQMHEDYTLKYFKEYLKRNKRIPVTWIEYDQLPERVKIFLQNYFKKKVRSFFLTFPSEFYIDDEDYVSIRFDPATSDETTYSEIKNTNLVKEIDLTPQTVTPELQEIINYLDSIKFFILILQKKGSPAPVSKLSGYLSQATEDIRFFIKYKYKSLNAFFSDNSQIFYIDVYEEVKLTSNYNKYFNSAKKKIKKSMQNSLAPSEQITLERVNSVLKLPSQNLENSKSEITNNTSKDSCNNTECNNLISNTPIVNESACNNVEKEYQLLDNSEQDSFSNITDNNVSDDTVSEGNLLQLIYTVELYCLSVVEEELWNNEQIERETIQFFTDILIKKEMIDLTSLKGYLSNAPKKILSFMNKFHKGSKFEIFFFKHKNIFNVKSYIVTLRPAYSNFIYNHDSEDKCKENYTYKIQKFNSLYKLNYFKELITELFAFLYDIISFPYKEKTKLSRLTKLCLLYPNCKEFIKITEGKTLVDKTRNFLNLFSIFEFSSEDCIYLKDKNSCNMIAECLKEAPICFQNKKIFTFSYNLYRKKFCNIATYSIYDEYYITLNNESKDFINQIVLQHLNKENNLKYYSLPSLLPKNILVEINDCKMDSFSIVTNLLNYGFTLKNGFIKLNNNDEICECPGSKNINLKSKTYQIKHAIYDSIESSALDPDIEKSEVNNDCEKESSSKYSVTENELFNKLESLNGHTEVESSGIDNPITKTIDDTSICLIPSLLLNNVTDVISTNVSETMTNLLETNPEVYEAREKFKSSNANIQNEVLEEDTNLDKTNSNIFRMPESIILSNPLINNENSDNLVKISNSTLFESKTTHIISSEENTSNFEITNLKKQSDLKISNDIVNNLSISNDSSILLKRSNHVLQKPFTSPQQELNNIQQDRDKNVTFVQELICKDSFISLQLDKLKNHMQNKTPDVKQESGWLKTEICDTFSEEAGAFDGFSVDTLDLLIIDEDADMKQNKIIIEDTLKENNINEKESANVQHEIFTEIVSPLNIDIKTEIDLLNNISKNLPESNVESNNADILDSFFEQENRSAVLEKNYDKKISTIKKTDLDQTKEGPSRREKRDSGFDDCSSASYSKSDEQKISSSSSSCEDIAEIRSSSPALAKSKLSISPKTEFETMVKSKTNLSLDFDMHSYSDADSENSDLEDSNITMHIKEYICKNIDNTNHNHRENIDDQSFTTSLSHEENYPKNSLEGEDYLELDSALKNNRSKDFAIQVSLDASSRECLNECNKVYNLNQKQQSNMTGESCCQTFSNDVEILEKLSPKNYVKNKSSFTNNDSESLQMDKDRSVKEKESLEYPLQPLSAQIALITPDSCIAQTKIGSRNQTIYFLKSVFSCDKHECCSNCFNLLTVGDTVSCFVPLTEIKQQTWIAFMVSKDNLNTDRINDVNVILNRQICENILDTDLSRLEDSSARNCLKNLNYSPYEASKTNLTIQHASVQTDIKIKETCCQTDKSCFPQFTKACQTIKDENCFISSFCQTELTGEIKAATKSISEKSQTYSTGEIMITEHYHL